MSSGSGRDEKYNAWVGEEAMVLLQAAAKAASGRHPQQFFD